MPIVIGAILAWILDKVLWITAAILLGMTLYSCFGGGQAPLK